MKYLYTIKIPFEAIDDISARMKVSEINQKLVFYANQPESECKLQNIKERSQPRKIDL